MFEALLREREIVKERLARTDRMIFSVVSVLVVPMSVFLAYAVAKGDALFGYGLLFVPIVTVFFCFVMGILYMHHYVCNRYNRALVREINALLERDFFIGEKLDFCFFVKPFGLQSGMAAFAFLIFTIGNGVALYMAPSTLKTIDFPNFDILYWALLILSFLVLLTSGFLQFVPYGRSLNQLISAHSSEPKAENR